GLATVGWLLASWVLALQLIVLATGSMSPGMPPGTAAVIQATDAADLAVGDVVTVHRSGDGAPVTHRIVAIDAADDAAARILTLRGDANGTADRDRYEVVRAGRVVAALPSAGYAVVWARSPIVMTATAVVVGVLVAWAFWPSPAKGAPRPRTPRRTA